MAHARRSAIVNVMVEAAEKAGRALVRDFGEVEHLQVSRKGPGNFVSTADHKSERLLKSLLQKARPKFGFLMEESGEEAGEDKTCRWIVDPLDGTTNFLHGIPHWSLTIALEKEGEIVAGVTYDPIKDEMFWAEKGMGAYMNNRRLQVAGRTSLDESVIAAYPSRDVGNFCAKDLYDLHEKGMQIRTVGSTCLDLAYVAGGRFDGYAYEGGINAWDVAVGALLVKEAKGVVSDITGGKNFIYGKSFVAGNAAIHAALLKQMKNAQDAGKKVKSAS